MKFCFRALLGMCCLLAPSLQAQFWTTAYYTGDGEKAMPVSTIDFSCVTHVVHFAVVPNADGSLNLAADSLNRATAGALTARAHAAGRKALVCVGGAGSGPGFRGAASPAHCEAFVTNLVNLMTNWGYDGIDLDWEPLVSADFPAFTNLVGRLRHATRAAPPGKLLTAAVSAYPVYGDPADSEGILFASLQTNFDQINIMTYDLSGPYEGWVSWFNSPIYDGGARFASTGALVPSIDGAVRGFLTNGVSPAKMGVGVPFYGDLWSGGVWEPRQRWKTAPSVQSLPYAAIMSGYFNTNLYHWDAKALTAYLSVPPTGADPGRFISYDDERACREKVRYVREHHLGGLIIWQLADGHFGDESEGRRDPLLRAIKDAVAAPLPLRKDTAINIIR